MKIGICYDLNHHEFNGLYCICNICSLLRKCPKQNNELSCSKCNKNKNGCDDFIYYREFDKYVSYYGRKI